MNWLSEVRVVKSLLRLNQLLVKQVLALVLESSEVNDHSSQLSFSNPKLYNFWQMHSRKTVWHVLHLCRTKMTFNCWPSFRPANLCQSHNNSNNSESTLTHLDYGLRNRSMWFLLLGTCDILLLSAKNKGLNIKYVGELCPELSFLQFEGNEVETSCLFLIGFNFSQFWRFYNNEKNTNHVKV